VQLELSAALRASPPHRQALIAAVREVLLRRVARRAPPGVASPESEVPRPCS
jgi:hypothetical protein